MPHFSLEGSRGGLLPAEQLFRSSQTASWPPPSPSARIQSPVDNEVQRTDTLTPFPFLHHLRGSRGCITASGGAGLTWRWLLFHFPVFLFTGLRGHRFPSPPVLSCQFPSHLPSLGSRRGLWPSIGCVALAPAACLLANSDYFYFSVLSWVPLFLTVHFLWTQD